MLNHAELIALLPHRHPILLVDRAVAGRAGEWIVTLRAINASEPCYAAVAPGSSIASFAFPSTLVLESFVQSAGVLWAWSARDRGADHGGTLVFAGARDITYHRPAFPGDTMRHRVTLTRVVGSAAFFTGTTEIADTAEPICKIGSIVLATRPPTAGAQPDDDTGTTR